MAGLVGRVIQTMYEASGRWLEKDSRAVIGAVGAGVGLDTGGGTVEGRRVGQDNRQGGEQRVYELLPEIDYRLLYQTYLQVSWVRACVDVIAKSATARGVDIVPTKANPSTEQRDQLQTLLTNPNPEDTGVDVLREIATHLGIFGDGYWELVLSANKSTVQEIYPLDPVSTVILSTINGNVRGYKQVAAGFQKVLFAAQEAMHFRQGTLIVTRGGRTGRSLYGLSPLSSLLLVAEQDLWAQLHNRAFFKNGAKVRGMYVMGDATKEQVKRNREFLQSTSAPEYAHRDLVLEGKGVEYHPIGSSPKDMEFAGLRRFNRDEILAVYQVPPSLIAIIETGNIGAGTGESQQENFKEEVVIPLQQSMAQRINNRLVKDAMKITDWEVRFNVPEIVSEKTQADIDVAYVTAGVRTADDVAVDRGFKTPVAGMEKALGAAQVGVRAGRTNRLVDLTRSLESDIRTELRAQVRRVARALTEQVTKDLAEASGGRPFEFRHSTLRHGAIVFRRFAWPVFVKASSDLESALAELDPSALARVLSDHYIDMALESLRKVSSQVGRDLTLTARMREDMLGNAKELGQYVSQQLADAVRAAVIEGVAAGESMTEIRDRISELDQYQVEVRPAGGTAFKRQQDFGTVAEVIARTESRRIYTEVGKAGMREAGVEKVRWLAASDPDPICAPLAGQVYDINDVPFGGPPAHHNCRCALQPVVE